MLIPIRDNRTYNEVSFILNKGTRNSNLYFGFTDLHNVEYISVNPETRDQLNEDSLKSN